ncbi:hypothetical protein B0H12DRAFT_1233717 [Mycena haematopus]|nr:hypothetical protein B0H12DRAFT_1233717 [Mycena haematopus]
MLDPPTPRSTRPDRTAILDARIDIDDAPRSIYTLHCDPRPHKRTSAYLSPACSAVTLEPHPAAPFQRWDFEPLPRSQGPPHQTAANAITPNPQIKMQVRGTSAQLHPRPTTTPPSLARCLRLAPPPLDLSTPHSSPRLSTHHPEKDRKKDGTHINHQHLLLLDAECLRHPNHARYCINGIV